MNILIKTAILGAIIGTAGCATILDGTTQNLTVKAVDNKDNSTLPDANCVITDKKGTRYVLNGNPDTVLIKKRGRILDVECVKEGYEDARAAIVATGNPVILANLLLGGVVGAVVDVSTGAAYNYPAITYVPMQAQ